MSEEIPPPLRPLRTVTAAGRAAQDAAEEAAERAYAEASNHPATVPETSAVTERGSRAREWTTACLVAVSVLAGTAAGATFGLGAALAALCVLSALVALLLIFV